MFPVHDKVCFGQVSRVATAEERKPQANIVTEIGVLVATGSNYSKYIFVNRDE
jgi:hypothetical protein